MKTLNFAEKNVYDSNIHIVHHINLYYKYIQLDRHKLHIHHHSVHKLKKKEYMRSISLFFIFVQKKAEKSNFLYLEIYNYF